MAAKKEWLEPAIENGLEWMTNSLPGAIVDVVFGIGGDGRYGSSAEQFFGATQVKHPDITILPTNVVIGSHVVPDIEQAVADRARDTEKLYSEQLNSDQLHAERQAQEAAFYAAQNKQQEQEQAQGVQQSMGR